MSKRADFRDFLKAELERRKRRNPMYSLRSFARDLDTGPSRLSAIMNGKRGFTVSAIKKISQTIGISEEDQNRCINFLGEEIRKKNAQLKNVKRQTYQSISEDNFRLIASWYHHAIIELSYLKGFQSEVSWISKFFKLDEKTVQDAVDLLFRLGLIKSVRGGWEATNDWSLASFEAPSDAVKLHHTENLKNAQEALYKQSVEDREFSSLILSVNKSQMPAAKKFIRKFVKDFADEFGISKSKNAVYCLTLQYYELGGASTSEKERH